MKEEIPIRGTIKEIPAIKFEMDYKKSWEKAVSKIYDLQEEIKRQEKAQVILDNQNAELQEIIDKAIEILGQYMHYSTPTEEQNSENEDKVWKAYDILQGEDTNVKDKR